MHLRAGMGIAIVLALGCGGKSAKTTPEPPPPTTTAVEPEPGAKAEPVQRVDQKIVIEGRVSKPETVIVINPGSARTPAERDALQAAEAADQLFDTARTPEDFVKVSAAYQHAIDLAGPKHWLVPLLRYKIAWSFYRGDDYPGAFAAFWAVVADPAAVDVRREALEYLAIIIIEPSWSAAGSGKPDPIVGLERPAVKQKLAGSETWIHELLYQVGAAHEVTAEWPLAAAAYDLAATRAPDAATRAKYRARASAARTRH